MPNEPLLEIRGLSKEFPVSKSFLSRKSATLLRAVDDVSLTVGAGETVGLVGESGCGKSTTGKMVMQLLDPTRGSIRYEGQEMAGASRGALAAFRRDVQMVFQDPYSSLNPRKTVAEIINLPLQLAGRRNRVASRTRIQELLEMVGLDPNHANRYPHQFSGGQRQRIGIARALAVEPRLIVLDEPVSALDLSVQAQIINLLQDLQTEFGLSYLFISHDLTVVEYLSHRVAVMYLGRIVELASAEELFRAPKHPYTEALLSANLSGQEREEIVLEGEIPSPLNVPSGCRFHTRCPHVQMKCRGEEPGFRQLEPCRRVSCHFPLGETA